MPRVGSHEPGEGEKLRFSNVLECPNCGAEDEYWFTSDEMDVEQMTDAPVARQKCSACGHEWDAEAEMWTSYSDGA